jgi:hypothetical protein
VQSGANKLRRAGRAATWSLLGPVVAFGALGAAHAETSDECASWRAEAAARTAGIGFPYITGSAAVAPGPVGAEGGREERARVGVALDLHDWSRRAASSSRAEAECLAATKLAALANAPEAARALVDRDGLFARQGALDAAKAEVEAELARRKRRLQGFQETRPRVDVVAAELSAIEQERIANAARLAEAERRLALAGGEAAARAADDALLADARSAAAEAALARAAEARGPAWAVTVGAGWERRLFYDEEGEMTEAGGRPRYASVDFKWMLGSAVAGALAVGGTGSVAAVDQAASHMASWQADRAASIAEYSEQLARVRVRRTELASDLALARRVAGDTLRDFVDRLVREDHRLAADEADWSARLAQLGGAPAKGREAASAPPTAAAAKAATFRSLTKLDVTEGVVDAAGDGAHRSASSKLRARVLEAKADDVIVDFKYLGPTKEIEPLESGEKRRQFGVYLAAKNQCNLLYAMWRLTDEATGAGELVVQRKLNPGMSTHGECGNGGYQRVAPARPLPLPKLVPGVTYRYTTTLAGETLTVRIDGVDVWTGTVPLAGLAPGKDGGSGVRSDNVRIELHALEKTGEATP